jgi:hypothetical protein
MKSIDQLKSGFPGGGMLVGRMAPGTGPATPISIADIAQAVAETGVVATPGQASPGGAVGANPTATATDTVVNGVATTFMRSDAAPPVQKGSASVFGILKVDGSSITASGGVISAVGGGGGSTGLWSQVLSATPTAASTGLSTWLNQGSATTSDLATGMSITMPAGTGANVAARYKAAPGTPYTITALIALTSGNGDGTNNPLAGIGFTDGTKLQWIATLLANVSNSFIQVNGQNTGTSAVSNQFSAQRQWPNPMWLRIADDGTNAIFSYSFDGVTFLTAYTIAKASGFLGGSGYTNVGLFVGGTNNNDGVNKTGTLLSWKQA